MDDDNEVELVEVHYFVRYMCPLRKKMLTTRWRMTEAEAAARYAGQCYEILRSTAVERRVGGDSKQLTLGHLYSTPAPRRRDGAVE